MKRKLSIAAGTIAIFIAIAVIGQPTALHLAGLHPPYEGKVAGAFF